MTQTTNPRRTGAGRVGVAAATALVALAAAGIVAANAAEGERSVAQTSVAPPAFLDTKVTPPAGNLTTPLSSAARTRLVRQFVLANYAPKLRAKVFKALLRSPNGVRVALRDQALRSFVAEKYAPRHRATVLAKLKKSKSADRVLAKHGFSY